MSSLSTALNCSSQISRMLCPPTGREPQTDSRVRGVGVHHQGGEYRADRRNREEQNGPGVWPAVEERWRTATAASSSGRRILFDELYASVADRSTRQLFNRLARLDVLQIDELRYLNLKPEQSNRSGDVGNRPKARADSHGRGIGLHRGRSHRGDPLLRHTIE
jgi:hypothetical protein